MASLQYSQVVGAGRGYTTIRTPTGQTYTVSGTRSTRNNNPGNIEYGKFARSQGAIGTDGRFAVFPSREQGFRAMQSLVFGGNYANLSLKDAIARYAPPHENHSLRYAMEVAKKAGVSLTTKMKDIPVEVRGLLTQAMAGVEGLGKATIKDQQGNVIGQINPSRANVSSFTPDTAPLPPQRFQPIAAAPVAPTAQNMQTAMNLANIPARGQMPSVPQTFSAPLGQVERAALPDIPATPLSRPVSPTPPAALASVNAPAPSRGFGLVSSAQAAPMPSIPAAALGVGQITPPSFASAQMMAPATTTPEQRLGVPSVPSMPSRPVTPTPAAALAAMTAPQAPSVPSALTAPNTLGAPQTLAPPNEVQPTFVPAQPVAPPVTPVAPPAIPSVPKTPDMRVAEAHAASSFPTAPRATAMDVYNGLATQGVANNGNMVSRDQYGNTSVTNQYGVTTTTNPRGMQSTSRGVPSVPSAPSAPGIAGPLGNPGIQTQPSGGMFGIQPAKTETGNIARGVVGSMAGSAIGSAAGPIGSIIGAAIGRSIAQGRNPLDALGGNRSGMMSFNSPVFGTINAYAPQTGGAFGTFPGAPTGVHGALGGTQSNRDGKSMSDISPGAAAAIGKGVGGLY